MAVELGTPAFAVGWAFELPEVQLVAFELPAGVAFELPGISQLALQFVVS